MHRRSESLRQLLRSRTVRRIAQLLVPLLERVPIGPYPLTEQLVHQRLEGLVRPAEGPQVLDGVHESPRAASLGIASRLPAREAAQPGEQVSPGLADLQPLQKGVRKHPRGECLDGHGIVGRSDHAK